MGLCASAASSDKYLPPPPDAAPPAAAPARGAKGSKYAVSAGSSPGDGGFAPSLPPSWQLTQKETEAAVHAIFQEFDTDGNGHIDESELGALLSGLLRRGGADTFENGGGFTGAEVKRVMRAFDADGNGTVEEAELVEWIVDGVSKSVQQRRAFARSTPLASKLDKFLTATARVAVDFSADAKRRKAWSGRQRLKGSGGDGEDDDNSGKRLGTTVLTKRQALKAVHAIFEKYDDDTSGYLDSNELDLLLHQLPMDGGIHMAVPFTHKDVQRVMKAFDEDGDGVLEEDELARWVIEGMSRTEAERRKFAKTTPLAKKLDEFLTAIIRLATEWCEENGEVLYRPHQNKKSSSFDSAKRSSSGKRLGSTMLTKAQALKALHAIFAEYDKDESGYLDEAEMTELLHKLPIDGRVHMVKPFTPKDVKSVMKAFDEDGDGLVEEKELAHWVLEGMGRYEKERRAFARTTELAGKLDKFLTAMIHLATDWCEMNDRDFSGPGFKNPGDLHGSAMNRRSRMSTHPGRDDQDRGTWADTMENMENELSGNAGQVHEELDIFREKIQAIEEALLSLTAVGGSTVPSGTLGPQTSITPASSDDYHRKHQLLIQRRNAEDVLRIQKLESMVETLCERMDIKVDLGARSSFRGKSVVDQRGTQSATAMENSPKKHAKHIALPSSPSSEQGNTGDWSIEMVHSSRSDHSGSVYHMSFDTSSGEEEEHSEDGFDFEISFDANETGGSAVI
eukprot:g1036.t1